MELQAQQAVVSSVPSAELERKKSVQLYELRRSLWTSLLSMAALVDPIVDEARKAAEQRNVSLPRLEDGAGLEGFIDALVAADTDYDVADRVLADLTGPSGVGLAVGDKVRKSTEFRAFIARAQGRRAAIAVARRNFAADHTRLVATVASRYRNTGLMSFEDLVQEGTIGLMTAVDRFDPHRGFRFSTYAVWWIRHAITRALSDRGRTVRLPAHVVEMRSRVRRAAWEFERENRRLPSNAELAEICELPVRKVERLQRVLTTQHIPRQTDLEDGPSADALDNLPDEIEDPAEHMDDRVRQALIEESLMALRPMEHAIVRMRFGLDDDPPKSLREIGEMYALSRERIRQLQNRALLKIRTALEGRGIESPLASAALA